MSKYDKMIEMNGERGEGRRGNGGHREDGGGRGADLSAGAHESDRAFQGLFLQEPGGAVRD